MKKITVITIVLMQFCALFLLSPQQASAREIWDIIESQSVRKQLVFISTRDVYRLAYSGVPIGANSSLLNFWSSDNTYYSLHSDNPPSGTYYLTCNGVYILEFFKDGVKVAETGQIRTTKIVNPGCQSYTNPGELHNELNLHDNNGKLNDDGTIKLNWDGVAGADRYDIYKNGELVGSTTDTEYNIDSSGAYTVTAVDGNGDVLGESDYNAPDPFPSSGGENGCNACEWLTDLLACPAWDTYMGELTDAIKAALPPPPDWESISQTFVNSFADYFGEVPVPPSVNEIKNEITPPLPPIDTTVPEANITPTVPEDYNNGPLDTDITTGPEISVEDGSEAFEIYEPDEFIKSDGAGVFVYPDDSRNHSDGIKTPDTITTDYPKPVPTATTGGEVPPVDLPVPSGSGGGTMPESPQPTPAQTESIIPIPRLID